jgi:hypothetical protein
VRDEQKRSADLLLDFNEVTPPNAERRTPNAER